MTTDSDEDPGQQEGDTVDCDPTYEANCASSEPQLLTQRDFKYVVRDLSLSKKEAEPLGSRLKGWNLLRQGTDMFLRSRQNKYK